MHIDSSTYNKLHRISMQFCTAPAIIIMIHTQVNAALVDQIEFADVIIVNKVDMVAANDLARVHDLINKLNPRAKVIESNYGKIDVKKILNTNSFDLSVAQTGVGWLQDLHAMTVREVSVLSYDKYVLVMC